jgi:hypothetical protein
MTPAKIPGYNYGTPEVPRSPVSEKDFDRLKQTVLFTDFDVRYLRMSKDVLADQVESVMDVWYGYFGSHPFLMHYFARKSDGQADPGYLAAVRRRFAQWINDTADANYDQKWLDYQYEIGLRHHRIAKNKTDHVDSVEVVHYRYLPLAVYPIVTTLKPFLANKGHLEEDVEGMYQAWLKSLLLQVTLWSQPYVKDGDF